METNTMPARGRAAPGFAIHDSTGAACKPEDVKAALARVLDSADFCKAQRTSRLLRFLVEKSLAGAVRETSEYAIGIDVFDRDPGSYSTGEDPIVRIQMGRLREKLKVHYAAAGARSDLRIVIPIGSYMPRITRTPQAPGPAGDGGLLAVLPLTYLSPDPQGVAFTHGLSEELSFQLFKRFGHQVVAHTFPADAALMGAGRQRLEGSIRIDDGRIRASLRLVDAAAGSIAWAEQFDRTGPCAIAMQEELAIAVCGALKQHFSAGQATLLR
jgi:TolB-like protein